MTHRADRRDAPHKFFPDSPDSEWCNCGWHEDYRLHQPLWWRWTHPRAVKRGDQS